MQVTERAKAVVQQTRDLFAETHWTRGDFGELADHDNDENDEGPDTVKFTACSLGMLRVTARGTTFEPGWVDVSDGYSEAVKRAGLYEATEEAHRQIVQSAFPSESDDPFVIAYEEAVCALALEVASSMGELDNIETAVEQFLRLDPEERITSEGCALFDRVENIVVGWNDAHHDRAPIIAAFDRVLDKMTTAQEGATA